MRERYWYVVVGLIEGQDDTSVTVSEKHALQPTLTRAQEELRAVLSETITDAQENDYTFDYTFEDDRLIIDMGYDAREIWAIHKVKRN